MSLGGWDHSSWKADEELSSTASLQDMGRVSFIFQNFKLTVMGHQTCSTGMARWSGRQDMVVDIGLLSIEVVFNEFIKRVREERGKDNLG